MKSEHDQLQFGQNSNRNPNKEEIHQKRAQNCTLQGQKLLF